MAINYNDLVAADKSTSGSIRRLVNHNDVDATLVLTEAESWIYNRLRAYEMRSSASWSAAIGQSGFALPSGFLDNISVKVDGADGRGLEYKHEDLVDVPRDEDGDLYEGSWPSFYYILDGAIQFDIELDEARTGDIWYYKYPTALGASNQTNFLTVKYPTLLTNVCRAFGFRHRQRIDDYLAELKLATGEVAFANEIGQARRGQSVE